MTYEKLFYLKFKKGLSTFELSRLYPEAIDRVSEVALADVPESTLREILKEKRDYDRVMWLKRRFGFGEH